MADPAKSSVYKQVTEEVVNEDYLYRFWLWNHFRNSEGVEFTSWDDFNGPVQVNGDTYTATMRSNVRTI